MKKRDIYISVVVAVFITVGVALLSFKGGMFQGAANNVLPGSREDAMRTCRDVRAWFDQGVLTSQHPDMVKYIVKCQNAGLWNVVRPVAPVQTPQQICAQVQAWDNQGVLTAQHPEMVYYIAKCKNARLWNQPVPLPVVTAQRCAQIQKWILLDVFTSQHSDSYADLHACRDQFPNIVTR
ncbi:hypothetical protein KBD59_00015 [Candidatus Gracilibacteria bacterium]|nr:hypothetical protein [Candidatus Gracilibacteria bacterium]